jgi:hypothetical protein
MTTLEELEKLLKAGTPGPWEKSGVRTKCIIEDAISIGADGLAYIYLPIGKTHNEQAGALNDAALIVAAINALPALLEMGRDYAKLNEPDGVLLNMMRGTIPKVSANSLHKLYTEDELINAARNVFSARIADHDAALKGT